jgi:hypothetical protein
MLERLTAIGSRIRRHVSHNWLFYGALSFVGVAFLASRPAPVNSIVPMKDPLTRTTVTRVNTLDQGWDWDDRLWFYNTDQGSQLIPYRWALHLERPSQGTAPTTAPRLVFSPANLAHYGFLPQIKDEFRNPDGLPVGFVKDPEVPYKHSDGWLGLTCAACHTTQINYRGVGYLVDGAPGLGDVQGLLLEITAAMKETLDNPTRFDRFAVAVLGDDHDDKSAQDELLAELGREYKARRRFDEVNHSTYRFGYARVDAFGIILNQVLQTSLEVPGDANRREPNAPVSYPFLWDTPQHDRVQWNGIARNRIYGTTHLGPLSRNVGEVLGVFGNVNVHVDSSDGYPSSVRRLNLLLLEEHLKKLYSPQWPKGFPPIDKPLAKQGEDLFKSHCISCHEPIDRLDPRRTIVARMIPLAEVGTDERMAKNVSQRMALTGLLAGRKAQVFFGDPLPKVVSGSDVLSHVVIGVIAATPKGLPSILPSFNRSEVANPENRTQDVLSAGTRELEAYKARPLNGIWATAPYLHNGSVPNLDELLKPASKRVKKFFIGTREFDPHKVGFVSDKCFRGAMHFDTREPGNSNIGHEYGPLIDGGRGFNDEQRRQLIEYMKTL